MTYQLVFHPEAELEYRDAYRWYELQKEGLGSRFEEQVEHRLKQIEADPEAYGFSKGSYREVAVQYFPFTIIYQISKRTHTIYILAIYHTARNPESKYRKL